MTSGTPLVSVVTAALNAERTVGQTVASVRSQTFEDWELVFIDDGSSDGTAKIVHAFGDPRIRITRCDRRQGVAARLNQGVAQARGKYIARIDADDVAYPERFARQLAFLEAHPEVDLVGSATMVFSDHLGPIGIFRGPRSHDGICQRPHSGFPLAAPTWFGRHSWFGESPYWDSAIRAEDQGLLLRRHLNSRFANLDDVLVGYRQNLPQAAHILRGRWDYSRQVVSFARTHRNPAFALATVGTQAALTAATVSLIGLGMGEAVLRRRFVPATAVELRRWEEVHQAAQLAAR